MDYAVKPSEQELRKARELVQGALEASKTVGEKEEELDVELGWTGEEYVKEKMDGVAGFTHSDGRTEINFNTGPERWKEMLKSAVAHEFAHSWFFEKRPREELSFNWQDIIFEAHSQHFAEKVFPGIETPWRKRYSREEVEDYWPDLKQELNREIDRQRTLFFGSEEFPEWIGYSLAYLVGGKLLEEHGLEDLPGLKRSDVIEAGDELFGG